jgi:hypothetical protein
MHFLTKTFFVFLVLPVACRADEVVAGGAMPMVTAAILLIVANEAFAAAVAGALRWIHAKIRAVPRHPRIRQFGEAAGRSRDPCSSGSSIFTNGRATARMLEGVRGAAVRRVQLDHQLAEFRGAPAEEQIDPKMLFESLGQIKQALENRQPDAEKELNDLIQSLRAALARSREVDIGKHET